MVGKFMCVDEHVSTVRVSPAASVATKQRRC
jgi:hypothetical protein